MTIPQAQENILSDNVRRQPIERAQALVRAFSEDTVTSLPTVPSIAPPKNRAQKTEKFHLRAHTDDATDGHRWVVGTEKWADLRLPNRGHTAFHFTVARVGNSWFLKSPDTMPTLLVNGEPTRTAKMKDGDEIYTDNFLFIFNTTRGQIS